MTCHICGEGFGPGEAAHADHDESCDAARHLLIAEAGCDCDVSAHSRCCTVCRALTARGEAS